MNITPEQAFDQDVWYMLQLIKRKSLEAVDEKEPIIFESPRVIGVGIPATETQWKIIKKMNTWGIIKILQEIEADWRISSRGRIEFLLVQPRYDHVYNNFEIKCDLFSYLTKYPERLTLEVDKEDSITSFQQPKEEDLRQLAANASVVKDVLLRKYNAFYPLSEKGFFLGTADYMQYLDTVPGIGAITALIDKEYLEAKQKLLALEDQLIRDIDHVSRKLFKAIVSERIQFDALINAIQDFQGIKDGRVQSSEPRKSSLYHHLTEIIDVLYANGYKDIVKEYVKTNAEGLRMEFSISSAYYPYRDELKDFIKLSDRTLWGAWSKLVRLYIAVYKYREEIDRLRNDTFKAMDIQLLHEEIEDIIGSSTNLTNRRAGKVILEYKKEDYMIYLNKVHDFLINHLTILAQTNQISFQSETPQKVATPQATSSVIDCAGLQYSLTTCKLSYKIGNSKIISPETREMKFFFSLWRRRGEVVDFKDVARDVDLTSYKAQIESGELTHEDLQNKDFYEDVSLLRRDFRKLVLSLGMSKTEFTKLISRIPKKGYKLNSSD